MNPKIIVALAFTLIIALLGLIASGFSEGAVMGMSIRRFLIFILLAVTILCGRYWRAQERNAASASLSSLEKPAEDLSRLKPLYLAWAVVSAASYFFMSAPDWFGCSVSVAACLLAIFFTPEKMEDERVEHLKLKAIRAAFVASFFLVLLQAWSIGRGPRTGHFLSAFDLIIIAMLIALGLFHYWRWQDGRERRTD